MSEPMDPFEVARAALDDAYLSEIAAGRTPEGDDAIALLAAFRDELENETSEDESPVVVPLWRRRMARRIGVGMVGVVTALSATGVAAAMSGDRGDVLFPLHRAIFGVEGTSNTSGDTKTPTDHATVEPSEPTEVEPTEHASTEATEESHDGGSSSGDNSTSGSSDGDNSTSGSSDGGSVSGTSDGGSTETATPTPTTSDGGGSSDGSQTPSPSETPSSPDGMSNSSSDGTSVNSGDAVATPSASPSESSSN